MDLCVHCNLMVLQEFSPLPFFSVVYYLLVARLHPFRFVVYFPCSYQSLMSCGDLLFMNWSILKNWKEQSSSVWSVEWGLRLMDVKTLPLLISRCPCPRSHLLALKNWESSVERTCLLHFQTHQGACCFKDQLSCRYEAVLRTWRL
jgi:hypothetical protein